MPAFDWKRGHHVELGLGTPNAGNNLEHGSRSKLYGDGYSNPPAGRVHPGEAATEQKQGEVDVGVGVAGSRIQLGVVFHQAVEHEGGFPQPARDRLLVEPQAFVGGVGVKRHASALEYDLSIR